MPARSGGSRAASPASGVAAAALGTVAWGFTGIFVDLLPLPSLPVTAYRLCLGAVLMAIATAAATRRPPSWRRLRSALPAGLLLGADISLFFAAVKLTSIAAATVIGALQPALVLLVAGRWFGERVRPADVAWTMLSIAGVTTVALGAGLPGTRGGTGDLLAAASLFAFTGYWLLSKRASSPQLSANEYTFAVMAVAAAAVTPVAVLSGERFGPLHGSDVLWLVLLTVIPGAGHVLFNWAHRVVDVSVSSVISAGSPVVAAALADAVLGQRLNLLQWLGGAVAVAAVAMVAGRRRPTGGTAPGAAIDGTGAGAGV